MKYRKNVYFCYQCKKTTNTVEDLFVVEQEKQRTFCSNKCIATFFEPMMSYFEYDEKNLRKILHLEQEDFKKFKDNSNYTNLTLKSPDEVWEELTSVGDKIYTLIKKIESYYMIVRTFFYRGVPSFILFQTATKNEEFLNEYRVNKKIDLVPSLPPELSDILELKKSSYLAKLLEIRKVGDIPIEEFQAFDNYLKDTMTSPDEVYLCRDDDGDKVLSYIKMSSVNGISFYYIILCIQHESNAIPVISFPTLDSEVYKFYKQGEKLTGNILN